MVFGLGPITAVAFDGSGKYLVASGDKHVAVFHNVVGYQATIHELEEERKKAHNQAFKERLQQQIDDARWGVGSELVVMAVNIEYRERQ